MFYSSPQVYIKYNKSLYLKFLNKVNHLYNILILLKKYIKPIDKAYQLKI